MLTKYPETEIEYFSAIESLGDLIFWTEQGARCAKTPGGEKVIADSEEMLVQLFDEIFENFGVVSPQNSPPQTHDSKKVPKLPFGFKWYWTWFEETKIKAYGEFYKSMICSACPFSGGVERFVESRAIPCGEWNGSLIKLSKPFSCAKVSWGQWTFHDLIANVLEKGGDEVLDKFREKQKKLVDDFFEKEK